MSDPLGSLEEAEMVEILERIARSGGESARIQAIKTLRSMRAPAEEPVDDWDVIYGGGSNVSPIRRFA